MKKLASILLFVFLAVPTLFAQTPIEPASPLEFGDSIFFPPIQEIQPFFSGCEQMEPSPEKRKCSEEKMLEFLYSNLKYPKKALRKNCQGTVYISFVVEADGSVTNEEIIRDIGCGCGEEALRVLKAMPNWEPGLQRGRPVKVLFNTSIKFGLK